MLFACGLSKMSISNHGFIEWKEEFISKERGSRVVHYFLKDSNGDSVLAVVGTERSLRHMVYVVSDELLHFCGLEKSNNACFKWRSRREVVVWLTSLLSKHHSKSPAYESAKSLSAELSVTGVELRSYVNGHKDHFARNLKDHKWDIMWSGAAWSCGKQLKHYQAFCRNGTTITIHSFVLVMAKEGNHYLAYLEDMYEDKKGQKKVKVRWFHQSQEVVARIPSPIPHPKEVFITPHAQVISVECVDGLATVLTPEHYEKCLSTLPYSSSSSSDRTYLCFRQFRYNRIKTFNLSKLHGYFEQSILSCLDLHVVSKNKLEAEELTNGGSVKRGVKRSRSCKGRQRFTTAHSDVGDLECGSQIMACGPDYRILRFGLPGRKQLAVKYLRPQHWLPLSYKIGDRIELLCQDSGIRGCWFRCTVLQISQKRLKVQYEDVQSEDGCGNLEEWIPAFRPATPDKLGMRCSGRLTVRPCPPDEKLVDGIFEIGTPVDAWWSDGWWEGVVADGDNGGDDGLQVYFPAEDVFSIIQRRNLRISRDWIGNQWVDIGVKRDILAISTISPGMKVSACKVAESGGSAMSEREAPTNSGRDSVEEEKQALTGLPTINGLLENSKWVTFRKRRWNEDEVAKENDDNDDDDGVDRDRISAQDGNDDFDDVDGKLVIKVDVGSAGQTCEAVAA